LKSSKSRGGTAAAPGASLDENLDGNRYMLPSNYRFWRTAA
jgi:hypothetical protein